jgi:hypothetical protein
MCSCAGESGSSVASEYFGQPVCDSAEFVSVGNKVFVAVGISATADVGSIVAAGAQEVNIITTRISNDIFIRIFALFLQGTAPPGIIRSA